MADSYFGFHGPRATVSFDGGGRPTNGHPADSLGGKLRSPGEVLSAQVAPMDIVNPYTNADLVGRVVSNTDLWGGWGTPGSDYGLSTGERFSEPMKGGDLAGDPLRSGAFPDPFANSYDPFK
jgi:hypothetical protein